MQYCSLQNQIFLSPSDTATAEHRFLFGSASLLFWSYFSALPQYNTGHLLTWGPIFHVLSFCLFILFMGFLRQEYWSGLPFPSAVDHILSELSNKTCPSWRTLPSMTHSSIESYKTVIHVIILISFLWWCFLFWRPLDWSSCFFFLPSDGWR